MPRQHLNKFELQLCDYLLGNIVQILDRPRFAAQVDEEYFSGLGGGSRANVGLFPREFLFA